MNKPPALPIAPMEYDAAAINNLTRILTQYLNQVAADVSKTQDKTDVSEVLIWLS
jgi:hypothetical protein